MNMKKLIKLFFRDPLNRDELLASESLGFRFVNLVFFLTSSLIFFVIFWKTNLAFFYKNLNLGFLLTLNGISHLAFSIIAHNYSRKVIKTDSVFVLEKVKKSFWKWYLLVIGVPYLSLTFWLYVDHDISSALEMLLIFIGTLIFAYFVDWKKFIISKIKYSDFFIG